MISFDENKPVMEIRGVSTTTFINTENVCYSEDAFKKLLDAHGDSAFVCGIDKLRKDKNICLYAASKGASIDTLYTFGVLDSEIILQSLNASAQGISSVSYNQQVSRLFEIWEINAELFLKIVEMCPEGQSIVWGISHSSLKNQKLKDVIRSDKSLLLLCMSKDPEFYNIASHELKQDSEIKAAYESLTKKQIQEAVFYSLDGKPFSSAQEAMDYNQGLLENKKAK